MGSRVWPSQMGEIWGWTKCGMAGMGIGHMDFGWDGVLWTNLGPNSSRPDHGIHPAQMSCMFCNFRIQTFPLNSKKILFSVFAKTVPDGMM